MAETKTEKEIKEEKADKSEKVGKKLGQDRSADSPGEASQKKPSWIKMKPAELEKIVVDLAKKGEGPAKIGLILRDKYGIPKVKLFGKRLTQILKGANVEYRKEKNFFEARGEKLKGHLVNNKHDYPAARALTKNLWVLNKIARQGN